MQVVALIDEEDGRFGVAFPEFPRVHHGRDKHRFGATKHAPTAVPCASRRRGGLAPQLSRLSVRAQQGERLRRIGVLAAMAESDPQVPARLAAIKNGLRERGWKRQRPSSTCVSGPATLPPFASVALTSAG